MTTRDNAKWVITALGITILGLATGITGKAIRAQQSEITDLKHTLVELKAQDEDTQKTTQAIKDQNKRLDAKLDSLSQTLADRDNQLKKDISNLK